MSPPVSTELTIDRLGATGEGVVQRDGQRITVPFALPGERVRVELPPKADEPARLLQRLTSADDRVEPPCPHFGRCGGCAVQHLAPDAEGRWKAARIRAALDRHGVAAPVFAPTLRVPQNDRRRAELAFRRLRGGTVLGFQARGSREIVDMRACFVLAPALLHLLPALRACLNGLLSPGEGGDAYMLASDTGIDLRLDLPEIPDLAGLERLAAFAETADLARLSWRIVTEKRGRSGGDAAIPVVECRPVRVSLGGIPVDAPPGSFLQASPFAEAVMIDMILGLLDGVSPVLDLFSGTGTFTLPLGARGTPIHAVEGQGAALAALAAAARRAGLSAVSTERRDLAIRPLSAGELARYGAVIFDPPRIGAAAQAAEIAGSTVPLVVAVSCNPSSFARDAALLQAGGFRLTQLQPVDQFIWSPHTELVATFRRETPDRPRA